MFLTLQDGKRMYYEVHGEPEKGTVLLIHGLGADHEMWKPQIERYPGEGYRVIVPDVRGHGKTDSVEALAITDWSHDLCELLDHLLLDKVVVIGVSMGGVIAQQFAVDFPGRITALVLSDTFCELKSFGEKMRGAMALIGLYPFYLFGKEALAKGVASAYKTEPARGYFEKVTREARLKQIILSRKAINKVDLKEKIAKLEVPTLVMTGTDFGEGFVSIGRKVAKAIPGAMFVPLEDACDPSNLVNPEAFDRNVMQFLDKV